MNHHGAGSRVLVVDDEDLIRWSLTEELRGHGHEVLEAADLASARAAFEQHDPELVILDIRLPDGTGTELLQQIRAEDEDLPVVMITGHGTVATAVEVTRMGATEYIPKPFDLEEMMLVVSRALGAGRRRRHLRALSRRTVAAGYSEIVGQSPAMQRVFELLQRLEAADAPTILVTGESGTGKDLVARAIHQRSRRADEPFLEVDCTGLSDTLIQSELFGHERGSFTDAKARKLGLFEVAGRGTLFLDELGELPLQTQSKLLRALENRRFKRVGGTTDVHLKARIVAATNRDLAEDVEAGRFRKDLFYRLAVIPIEIPALRTRRGDVPLLVEHFRRKLAADLGRRVDSVEPRAMELLDAYAWPGNVRELRNVIERGVILCRGGVISAADLPAEIRRSEPVAEGGAFQLPPEGLDLAELERDLVRQALERAEGNQSGAARLLRIGRYALRYRMEKMGLLPGRSGASESNSAEA